MGVRVEVAGQWEERVLSKCWALSSVSSNGKTNR